MTAPFLETPRFPVDIAFDSSGGPRFSTTVVSVSSGAEWRNQNWIYPLYEFEVAKENRSPAVMEALIEFFNGVGGRYYGFRYKDWVDYTSASTGSSITAFDQLIGTGDGIETDFQLIKTYTVGAVSRVRQIKKPVSGTVVVSINNVAQSSGWTVDCTTGIISFATPPGDTLEIKAGFEFDIPVRFSSDALSVSLSDVNAFSTNITLQEIRL